MDFDERYVWIGVLQNPGMGERRIKNLLSRRFAIRIVKLGKDVSRFLNFTEVHDGKGCFSTEDEICRA